MIGISDVTSLRIRNMSLFCSFLVVSILVIGNQRPVFISVSHMG